MSLGPVQQTESAGGGITALRLAGPEKAVMCVINREASMFLSMRKTALKKSGVTRPGRALSSLWDTPRFDADKRSRRASHSTKKDKKSFKPWQRDARYVEDDRQVLIEPAPLQILVPGCGWVNADEYRC